MIAALDTYVKYIDINYSIYTEFTRYFVFYSCLQSRRGSVEHQFQTLPLTNFECEATEDGVRQRRCLDQFCIPLGSALLLRDPGLL